MQVECAVLNKVHDSKRGEHFHERADVVLGRCVIRDLISVVGEAIGVLEVRHGIVRNEHRA